MFFFIRGRRGCSVGDALAFGELRSLFVEIRAGLLGLRSREADREGDAGSQARGSKWASWGTIDSEVIVHIACSRGYEEGKH